ncbi:MAG: head GIN domain-containing protein [Rudaea sp.]
MNNKILVWALGAVIVVLGVCVVAGYLLAPVVSNLAGISLSGASGPSVTESRDVANFSTVDFGSVGELTITQGDHEGLTIQAEERILRQIKTEVKDGVLTIHAAPNNLASLNTNKGIYYNLTVIRLDGITLAGAGDIHARNIQSDRLSVTLSGGGTLEMGGEVGQQSVLLSGAGKYDGGNLKSRSAVVNLTGVGSATVWATDSLDAKITSVGSIEYYGNPRVTKEISGLGSINGLGSK